MLAKAFDVPKHFLWSPLTLLIRSFLIEHFSSCPNCGSENVVRDGYGERKTMPDIPMLECSDCGKDLCLRADTIFFWKHASEGELFIISWIFFGMSSRGVDARVDKQAGRVLLFGVVSEDGEKASGVCWRRFRVFGRVIKNWMKTLT